jgi:hypothetical protein
MAKRKSEVVLRLPLRSTAESAGCSARTLVVHDIVDIVVGVVVIDDGQTDREDVETLQLIFLKLLSANSRYGHRNILMLSSRRVAVTITSSTSRPLFDS